MLPFLVSSSGEALGADGRRRGFKFRIYLAYSIWYSNYFLFYVITNCRVAAVLLFSCRSASPLARQMLQFACSMLGNCLPLSPLLCCCLLLVRCSARPPARQMLQLACSVHGNYLQLSPIAAVGLLLLATLSPFHPPARCLATVSHHRNCFAAVCCSFDAPPARPHARCFSSLARCSATLLHHRASRSLIRQVWVGFSG